MGNLRCKGSLWLATHIIHAQHVLPVVLVLDATQTTNLVIVAVGGSPGPEKLVGTNVRHKNCPITFFGFRGGSPEVPII
jgi:hypothetical protein